MAKKKLSLDEQREALRNSIDLELAQWNHLYTEGGSDPFWSDGCNLNLVRNHIIYYLRKLDELDDQPRQLSFLSMVEISRNDYTIPPEVPNDYMAQKARIIARSKATADALEASPEFHEYLQLLSSVMIPKGFCFYDTREIIMQTIEKSDYITMRRYGDTESHLEDITYMISRLREFPRKPSAA